MNNAVSIISDLDGSKIVVINDICFRSRRNINWKQVEQYLKDYIGECFEIVETSEKIYIGSDFPDEFSHSNDTKGLKGANMKAKAKFGWYRYNTMFGIPVYNDAGILARYNIFSARMLVRCNEDGKLFLYDLVRIKKETSRPHEQTMLLRRE